MHPNKRNLLCALRHETPDHVPYTGEGAFALVDYPGRKPPRAGLDAWGVTWAPLPEDYRPGAGEPAESYPAAPAAGSLTELLTQAAPEPPPAAAFAAALAPIAPDDCLAIGEHPVGLLDRFSSLLGTEHALLALARDAEACRPALERIADHHVAIARAYLAAGAEAGWLADDYAGAGGPFLNPRLWRRVILPGLARIIAVYHAASAPVFFHTCGRAEAFIPDLLAAGVTAFNLESDLCDLPALKAQYGAATAQRPFGIGFYGGVPTRTLLEGTPDDVAEAVRLAVANLGRAGGLVLAPDQPLLYPAANSEAFFAAARRYGRGSGP